ncbi:Selenoprotein M [Lamellibrachia satsuma]|nr:Selenoprotein M [Lamellibrachia satsuma]
MPEVKRFIYDDVPLFHNVRLGIASCTSPALVFLSKGGLEVEHMPGASPVLLFLNKGGETVSKVELTGLKRQECNDLLLKKGFYKKSSEDAEVPEQYRNGPYVDKEEL